MRSRFLVGVAVLVGIFGVNALATRGDNAGPARRWTIVNFVSPVQLGDQFLMGQYLFVHDDEEMAKGEACTAVYRFDPKRGPREEIVAFHCNPAPRDVCATATFTVRDRGPEIPVLVEYQFAGDVEGHGVPTK
jgi:hypothetical protein